MKNGTSFVEEINVADAHPAGKRPFGRKEYINKFTKLTEGIISKKESDRFLKLVQKLKFLKSKDLTGLNIQVNPNFVKKIPKKGIF
jgi:2-methylcitrate dehydratase